ncbi:hypothetical protein L873DRAFT_1829325 [Choiromyces venosus 120613-1]|uniref:Uncharacterized protein n=1 Tax=Choiromyces venosus 120613-1 TaxID=1336337 RepID=A0A3N4JEI7_9PEZI|nr:hypothetical protein L873DRAFT_1829325 [Choiromyces venosus 120613-1]
MPRLKFSKIPRTTVECLDCCLDFTAPPLHYCCATLVMVLWQYCFSPGSPELCLWKLLCRPQNPTLIIVPFATRIAALGSNSIEVNQCYLQLSAIGKSTLTAALPSEKMTIPCLPRQYG